MANNYREHIKEQNIIYISWDIVHREHITGNNTRRQYTGKYKAKEMVQKTVLRSNAGPKAKLHGSVDTKWGYGPGNKIRWYHTEDLIVMNVSHIKPNKGI